MKTFLSNHVPPKWAHTVAFSLCIIPALLFSAHFLNKLHQNELIADNKNTATTDIGERISAIRALMASLTGLHQTSNNPDNSALLTFSEQIREHANYITAIGRYEHISDSERTYFEKNLSGLGVFEFEITRVDEQGKRRPQPPADWYYPISALEPMHPDTARLMGADLSSLKGLQLSLDNIAEKNDSLLTSFPDTWPYGGNLVLFQPVYRGQLVPTTDSARSQQSAGGFWIAIDVNKFLSGISSGLEDYSITAEIVEGNSSRNLFTHAPHSDQTLYLRSLYPRQEFTEKWTTGSSSLLIHFERDIGYSASALIALLITGIGLMAVSIQFTLHRLNKQKSASDRQKSRDALYQVREMAERTLNAVQDAIITLDANLCFSYINPAAVILFNARPSSIHGKKFNEIIQFQLLNIEDSVFDLEFALRNLTHNSTGEFDVVPLGHSHSDFILKLTLSSSYNHDGEITGHVLVMRNVSHERRLTAKLAYQANHDALTGCGNRYYFEQTLANLIDELTFVERTHALCYMDLDQFKIVNDTCGHRAGDRLLLELTESLTALTRPQDILSRLGGDEFGLLLLNVSPEETDIITQRLFQFFQNHLFRHEDKAFSVRASIGVVHIDKSCNNMKDVMSAADIACFSAKDAGRNKMCIYSPTNNVMHERSEELRWLPRLQNALQNDEFVLYVQPVAAIGKPGTQPPLHESVHHFEFLLRLRNPDGTEFTPWQFIRAAERYDLMPQIDRWVIRKALRTISELKGGPSIDCSFSINLSGQSAADPTLNEFITEQFSYYDVDPTKIWFELTETAAISHFSVAIELFQNIRALGCLIALDDFGSGLSSFGYLKNMPIDIIKIDGQFIMDIVHDKLDRQMVLAVKQLGEVMNIKTVAEFVENEDIMNELAAIGIDYAQGYHIGKPAPVYSSIAQIFNKPKAA